MLDAMHALPRPPARARGWRAGAAWPALALLPVALYALVLFLLLRSLQADDMAERVRGAAQGIARSLEAELSEGLAVLGQFGDSSALDRYDLETFRTAARRLLNRQQRWLAISLTDREREVVSLRNGQDFAPPLPMETETLGRVLIGMRPVVGQLRNEAVTLRVPVVRDGAVRFTVAATLDLAAFPPVLAEARLPPEWVATVTDAGNTVVARSGPPGPRLGVPAGSEVFPLAAAGRFGLGVQTLPGGAEVLTGVVPVGSTGWTVGVSVPAALAGGPYGTLRLALTVGGLWAFAVAVGLFAWLLRRDRRAAAGEARRLQADLERAAEADRRKSEFLAEMSHELRTPLTGILGFADLLATTPLTPRQRDWVGHQRSAGKALLTLVGDVLDFARIEEGAIALERVSFHLPGLLQDCAAIMRPLADQKAIGLRVELDPGLPQQVEGDPLRLRQVVTNLLSNAVKFTALGEVALEASAQPAADGEVALLVAVTDTGPGIPPDRLPHVFDRFVQAESATARNYGGSGLGLAICQRLVAAMGGSIRADSRLGSGSRFSFRILLHPVRTAPAPPLVPALRPLPARRPSLLVAEDSAANQALLRGVLEGAGYAVEIAVDGAEAVAAVQRRAYDLAILDIRMPVLDGLQAAAAIRALDGAAGRLPLLALTADCTPDIAEACRRAGFDGLLPKPFDLYRLTEAVAAQLRARQPALV